MNPILNAADMRRQMPTVEQYLSWLSDEMLAVAKLGYSSLEVLPPETDENGHLVDEEAIIFNFQDAYDETGTCWEVCNRLESLGYTVDLGIDSVTISWLEEDDV